MSRWKKSKPRDETPDLFDAAESERLKELGKAKAEANAEPSLLEQAREIARGLDDSEGITADDVMRGMVAAGHEIDCLGKAAGSLFKGKEWEWTGEMRRGTRVKQHAALLMVWKRRR